MSRQLAFLYKPVRKIDQNINLWKIRYLRTFNTYSQITWKTNLTENYQDVFFVEHRIVTIVDIHFFCKCLNFNLF